MINKKNTSIAIALLAAAGVTNSASAKDGFYLSSNVSNSTFSHTLERDTGSNTTPSITTRTEETDYGFGIDLGYKFHVTEDIYLAGEVFYYDQDIETSNVNNVLRTQLTVNETYGAKAKLGFDINEKFSLYGLLGTTTVDFDIRNSYTFVSPVQTANTDVDEFTIGLGAEYAVNDRWSVIAEYSQLNDVNFDPIPETVIPGQINDNEVDLSTLSFGLRYYF